MGFWNRIPEPWTPGQRRVLAGLLVVLLLVMSLRYAHNRLYVPDPQPLAAPRYADLADRLDPNTADANLLASLPSIGPARAREIVSYRERFVLENSDRPPFRRPEDLMQVHGIGPAIVNTIRPHLVFPPPEEDAR
jgi:hypothetical protein